MKLRIKPIIRKMNIGEKSNPPIGGIIRLTGDIIGSVICQTNKSIGCGFILPENIMINDITIDAMRA